MHSVETSAPITRDDTLLGVCQALGEDFGFNPVYLRIALGVSLIVAPVAVVAGYLAAAVLLGSVHWVARGRRRPSVAAPQAPAEAEPLPLAA